MSVFLQPLGPVCPEGRLGLDVRNAAPIPAVYAKSKILVLAQFLVQILFAGHAQLVADRLFPADLHLDAGVAITIFLTGHHTDLYGISPGGDCLYKGRCISSSTSGSQAKIVPVGKWTVPMSSTSTPIFPITFSVK